MSRRGFTLVEMMISMLILTVAILGLAVSAAKLGQVAGDAEIEAIALQAVEDRMSSVLLDTRYLALDSIYEGTESTVMGAPALSRQTIITPFSDPGTAGKTIDYTRVTVVVSGTGLRSAVARTTIVGAP